jgi:hypothetical protein
VTLATSKRLGVFWSGSGGDVTDPF